MGNHIIYDRYLLFAVPMLDIYSQAGNVSFPGWECFVPKLGIITFINGIGRNFLSVL